MSRRNRNRSNLPAAPVASAPELTVVDGNAVGVSPAGAVDTTEIDPVDAALAAIDAELTETAEIVALAEVEEDPEIAALLAEVEGNTGADVGEPEITETAVDAAAETTDEEAPTAHTVEDVVDNLEAVTAEDVAAVIENDADALLAELDAANAATTTTTAASATSKPKRQKATPPPAAPKRDFHTVAAIDPATLKANLDACSAQKVQEKAQNLIQSIEVGKRLSRYTSVAIKRLAEQGMVSSKTLVEAYEQVGLKTGTARAQAQQMTALFKIAGIASPNATAPRELVLTDRGLVDELTKLAA